MPSRNTVEIEIKGQDAGASDVLEKVAGKVDMLGKIAVLNLAGKVVDAARDAGQALMDMAKDAASVEGVERAFDGITKSIGKSSKEMLKALEDGSEGMIAQEDLMKSFNKAAQLVNKDFAAQLPEAMQYLSKVAAATGQDMNYMLDSLVTGVGRVSPMILDNLGVQVNLTEATQKYADSVGKSVDQLSKSEQQTAIMNAVLEKLKVNTESMPDVTDTAAMAFGRWDAKMKNMRVELGKKFLPAAQRIMEFLSNAADKILPALANVIEKYVTPAFEVFTAILDAIINGDYTAPLYRILGIFEDSPVSEFLFQIRDTIQAVAAGVPIFDVLANAVGAIQERAAAYGMTGLVQILQTIHDIIVNLLKPIGDWISENIKLQDILGAIGIIVASVVLPAIAGIIAAVAPLALTFAGLVLLVAGIRSAWENDFLGIRTFITEQFIPKVGEIWTKIQEGWATIEPTLQKFLDWFTVTALPAVLAFVRDEVLPKLGEIWSGIQTGWDTIKPYLDKLWAWFTQDALPTIIQKVQDLAKGIGDVVQKVTDWINKHPDLVKNMLIAVGVTLALFAAIKTLNGAMAVKDGLVGLLGLVKTGLGDVKTFLWGTVAPIMAIYAAVLLLVTAYNKLLETIDMVNKAAKPFEQNVAPKVLSGEITQKQLEDQTFRATQSQFGDLLGRFLYPYIQMGVNARVAGQIGNMTPEQTGMATTPGFNQAGGLPFVPRNNYPANLHLGERVLTAEENRSYDNRQISISFNGGGAPTNQQEADQAADMIISALQARGVSV